MAEDASASDLESEGVEATLCACCARNYEQRVDERRLLGVRAAHGGRS